MTTPSVGPGSTRRRSSSVGSLLRSVVIPGAVVPPTYAPSIATDWEVEPNEEHDDPFARPPPTPSSAHTTPGPIATPTRAESLSGGLGGLAANRIVIALEAIEEPENGSPQNLSLDESRGDAVARPSTPSDDDHVERVVTPMPLDVESGRSRSNSSSGSLFREHIFDRDPGANGDRSAFFAPVFYAPPGSEPSTPTAAGPQRFVPESPPRRRTDRRASSPVRPNFSSDDFGATEAVMSVPAPTTKILARSRSTSARLFSPGKLISIRRFRSSLRRTSGRLRPVELEVQSIERPAESSEMSFTSEGTADARAGQPSGPRPQLLGLAPPADVRLSVGSRKAWWKHISTGSRVSSTDDSRIFRDFSQGPAASFEPPLPPSLLRSSWSSQSIGTRALKTSASANARWSGYELPPLADVSPLSSSLFLPLARRSGSSKRQSLRRIESSPAMIENVHAVPEPTLLSLAAPSSKLSAGSFVTARSQLPGHGASKSAEPTLEVEFDGLGALGQTFTPLPDGTLSSPSSSAPYTPMTPSFDSIATPFWSRGDQFPFSPLTPVSPGDAACSD